MKHLRKAAELVTSPSRTARRGGKEAGGMVEVCVIWYFMCAKEIGDICRKGCAENHRHVFRLLAIMRHACASVACWNRRWIGTSDVCRIRPMTRWHMPTWDSHYICHAGENNALYNNLWCWWHLVSRFDEAVDQYHRALSLQPAFSFCSDMLTQALNDMCSFPAYSVPAPPTTQGQGVFQHAHMIDALFLPTQRTAPQSACQAGATGDDTSIMFSRLDESREESLISQFSAVPQQHGDRSRSGSFDVSSRFESPGSFRMQGGGMLGSSFQSFQGDDSPTICPGDDERLRDASRSRISCGQDGSRMSWDEDSVESYSRIAGRLSMNSAMSSD